MCAKFKNCPLLSGTSTASWEASMWSVSSVWACQIGHQIPALDEWHFFEVPTAFHFPTSVQCALLAVC
jgi:hypothetical protein